MIEEKAIYTEYVAGQKNVYEGEVAYAGRAQDRCTYGCDRAHISDRGELFCELDGMQKKPYDDPCAFDSEWTSANTAEPQKDNSTFTKTEKKDGEEFRGVKTPDKTPKKTCQGIICSAFNCITKIQPYCMISDEVVKAGDVCNYSKADVLEWSKRYKREADEWVRKTGNVSTPKKASSGVSPKQDGNVIKDSGDRTIFDTGFVRDMHSVDGKPKGRMDLLPWNAIMEVSRHCENGAKKYGEHNIDRGAPFHSLADSGARHLAEWIAGFDDEPHLVAACWNLLWLLEETITKPELNDMLWNRCKEQKETNGSERSDIERKRPTLDDVARQSGKK